jgi:hypothetical protein
MTSSSGTVYEEVSESGPLRAAADRGGRNSGRSDRSDDRRTGEWLREPTPPRWVLFAAGAGAVWNGATWVASGITHHHGLIVWWNARAAGGARPRSPPPAAASIAGLSDGIGHAM